VDKDLVCASGDFSEGSVPRSGQKKKQPRGGFIGCFQGVSKVIEVILAVNRQGWSIKVRRFAIDKTDAEIRRKCGRSATGVNAI
jgi:hypothetical protein